MKECLGPEVSLMLRSTRIGNQRNTGRASNVKYTITPLAVSCASWCAPGCVPAGQVPLAGWIGRQRTSSTSTQRESKGIWTEAFFSEDVVPLARGSARSRMDTSRRNAGIGERGRRRDGIKSRGTLLFLVHFAKMAAVRERRKYSLRETSDELGIARNEADARTYISQSLIKPSYVPMFTVDIKNTEGSILRFDCTFDLDDVVEEMEVDQSFRIQSVSAIPKHAAGNSESVYAADASNLDGVRELLCQTFKDYLRDQGVTPDALADLLEFYSAFEQHCYTEEFLKGVRAFLDGKN